MASLRNPLVMTQESCIDLIDIKSDKADSWKIDSERKQGYIIVHNTGRCKRLHKIEGGCWMARSRRFKSSEGFETLPGESGYAGHLQREMMIALMNLLRGAQQLWRAMTIISNDRSTFSRAPWSNRKGPRPVRSYVHHRGLQRLTWSERKKADWGNTLMDFTFKLIQTAINKDVRFILFENPEDLGALQQGPYEGQRPASMWQDEKFEALIQTGQIDTVAFNQQDFGTEYLKPTRLMLRGFTMHQSFVKGKPQFDDQGFYQGPLQKRPATRHLIGQSNSKFNTTGSEQWPSDFCKWVAQQLLTNDFTPIAYGGGNLEQDVKTSTEKPYGILEPDGPKLLGGVGNPRLCRVPGKTKEFHDGAGLTSPGRWVGRGTEDSV